jgi:predicted alpha/beta-hydrolase family hydrolase
VFVQVINLLTTYDGGALVHGTQSVVGSMASMYDTSVSADSFTAMLHQAGQKDDVRAGRPVLLSTHTASRHLHDRRP